MNQFIPQHTMQCQTNECYPNVWYSNESSYQVHHPKISHPNPLRTYLIGNLIQLLILTVNFRLRSQSQSLQSTRDISQRIQISIDVLLHLNILLVPLERELTAFLNC